MAFEETIGKVGPGYRSISLHIPGYVHKYAKMKAVQDGSSMAKTFVILLELGIETDKYKGV